MLQRLFQIATIFGVVLLVAGCVPGGDALLDDYRKRLENVLLGTAPAAVGIDLPRYPRTRELRQEPEDIRLDLLDAWALRGCDLFTLISERNSILGRVARPEVRLDYEQRLLLSIPRCLASPEMPDSLAEELAQILVLKQAQLPQRIWNATLAHPDYQQYWNGGSEPFRKTDEIDFEGYRDAQNRLAFMVAEPLRAEPGDWVRAIEPVAQYPMGGHSLYSMRVAIVRLQQTAALLEQTSESGRMCPMGSPRRELGFARNVMVEFFIGEVQPWLVRVDQRFLAGFEPLVAMSESLDVPSPALDRYIEELADMHQVFRGQIRDHVEAWQLLFERCGQQAVER